LSKISAIAKIPWKNMAGILTLEFPEEVLVCSGQPLQAKKILAAYPPDM